MTTFNRLAAVDSNFNFPDDIAEAFAYNDLFRQRLSELIRAPESPIPGYVEELISSMSFSGSPEMLALITQVISAQYQDPSSPMSVLLADLVHDEILDSLSAFAPGSVQDDATRSINFSTTNTFFTQNDDAALLAGLELTATGTGRPLEINVHLNELYHQVANRQIGVYLLMSVSGGAYSATARRRSATVSSPFTDQGPSLDATWTVPSELGVVYGFKFGVAGRGAGTCYVNADTNGATFPMQAQVRNT